MLQFDFFSEKSLRSLWTNSKSCWLLTYDDNTVKGFVRKKRQCAVPSKIIFAEESELKLNDRIQMNEA